MICGVVAMTLTTMSVVADGLTESGYGDEKWSAVSDR